MAYGKPYIKIAIKNLSYLFTSVTGKSFINHNKKTHNSIDAN